MTFANGLGYSADKRLLVEPTAAVPAGAMFIGGMAFNGVSGALYVRSAAVLPAGAVKIGGMAVASDGALLVRVTTPSQTFSLGGLVVDADGIVPIGPGAGVAQLGRWPITMDGLLAVSGYAFALDYEGAYMHWAAGPVGAQDGKKGTLSVWVRPASSGSLLACGDRFFISLTASNHVSFVGINAGGSTIMGVQPSNTLTPGTWNHVAAAWDLGNSTFVSVVNNVLVTVYDSLGLANDELHYNNANEWTIAKAAGGVGLYTGCVGPYWFDETAFVDWSVTANLRKVISAGGKPVDFGNSGELVNGISPLFAFSSGDPRVNSGTGGNGFKVNTSVATCSSSPSE